MVLLSPFLLGFGLAPAADEPATPSMCAGPIAVPHDGPIEGAPDDPIAAKHGVVFVNFDGATLSPGFDDSRTDTTAIIELAGPFAAYGDGDKRSAVVQAVRTDWAAYDVTITDVRPASGDYTMNMTGPSSPFPDGVLGIAPVDCDDSQTHNNITFAFHSADDMYSAAMTATTIGQEVAHSYGLEHVGEPSDIMNPILAGADPSFQDLCLPIVQQVLCPQQHEAACGTAGMQNSHLELLNLFGPAIVDFEPPTVAITYPADGDVFEPGAAFDIIVQASDDGSVVQVQLFNNGEALQVDTSEPYGWNVTNVPEGEYALHVVAIDGSGNEATSEVVTVYVGDAPADGGTDALGSDSDTDTDTDTEGQDGGDDGCGCVAGGPPAPAVLVGSLLLGSWRRRRRAR